VIAHGACATELHSRVAAGAVFADVS